MPQSYVDSALNFPYGDYIRRPAAAVSLVHCDRLTSDQAATGLKVMRPAFDFLVCLGRGRDTISKCSIERLKGHQTLDEYSRKFPLNSRDTSG